MHHFKKNMSKGIKFSYLLSINEIWDWYMIKNMFIVNAKLKPRCLTLHEIIIICLLCILKRENVSGTPMPHLADIGEHPLLLKSLMVKVKRSYHVSCICEVIFMKKKSFKAKVNPRQD